MAEKKSTKAGEESGVTEYDENYLGTSPEYQNSAYLTNAPIASDDAPEDPEEDDGTRPRRSELADAEQRVREHEVAMRSEVPENTETLSAIQAEVKPFGQWSAERESGRSGASAEVPEDTTKAELMEEARDLGVEGRSSMTKDELAAAVAEAQQNPSS
jgi:hypothetical protein